jgi:hypothetical protein
VGLTLGDLDLFPAPDEPRAGAAPRRACSHPRAARRALEDGDSACERCGKAFPREHSRRGRNNRARGNAIEREIGKALGLRRVGQYGGPDDLSGEMFVAQVKSGGAFPERLWTWLRAVPANAGQVRLLVVTDAPGPGTKRRAVVVLDLDDWRDLHGEAQP